MRKTTLISTFLIASLLLVGCSSSSEEGANDTSKSSSGKSSAFASSLKAVQDAKSYKFTAVAKVKGDIGGVKTDGELTMKGENSADGKTSAVVVDLSSLLGALGGQGGLGDIGSGEGLEIEQRIVDGTSYTKNLDLFGLGTETWTKQDVSELIKSNESQNPNQYLQYLEAAGSDVEKVGSEDINGVKTTHYKSVVTKEQVRKNFDSKEWKKNYTDQGLSEEDYAKFKEAYIQGLSDTPIDLWIDKDNLPVRMQISATINVASVSGDPSTSGDSKVSADFTIDFGEWGTELNIVAPPADQIVTPEQYQQQLKDQLLSSLGA